MKLLFASDSFKGSLTSKDTARLLEKAAKIVFGDETECVSLPVADGGEGTAEAVISAKNGKWVHTIVTNPLFKPIKAKYGVFSKEMSDKAEKQNHICEKSVRNASCEKSANEKQMSEDSPSNQASGNRISLSRKKKHSEEHAIIEMAEASGLTLVPPEKRNPLYTTSQGTGELILHALQSGITNIITAIGGSATNDGGTGCFKALGVRFLDKNDNELSGCGKDLEKIKNIDISRLNPLAKKAKITVMCDVNNPLCGPNGAVYTFSAQKGADSEIQKRLEYGMQNFRNIIIREFGKDPDKIPGSGAAGGLGAALSVFLNAELKSGIETVLDLLNFDKYLAETNLVVTGEGRTDGQSACGKAMHGIGEHAKAHGITAVGLSGALGKGADAVFQHGISSLMTAVNAPMTTEYALKNAETLYYQAALRMFRFIKAGMELKKN